ncbi:hypothetical protein A2767_03645 [Candidatus Roizmanbacteria bacterium RIFCSPHIGHO2_01_FULL_35_10]|uniref:Uncharacterized protein n=1 Tax=Candidatus Roizmanbacteria bacterium RIFCSPLOWO2_01_FULL_35_13 TaxID=1802055 RepID=A0A1F7IA40_9BACT|nr:MAG: hypothetical protein A2767_03645 [Candidatus Roizmanbacteria bacterium RIFCSPHIGHO2_01_FULL_35_10]OGK40219.1 MAG: hypothetical protein A3A74_06960 [Candidatus Roizmanbacteria bacterium RIFCSPLOWO2_01_FULL_35_13]
MSKQFTDPITLLWTTDLDFKTRVKKARKKVGLDSNNLPDYFGFELIYNANWDDNKKALFFDEVIRLFGEYRLYGWKNELKYFVATGKILPFKEKPISDPIITESEDGLNVTFKITKPIEKTNLVDWIKINWEKKKGFYKKIKNYFQNPDFLNESKIDTKRIKRILELRDKDKLPFSQIADRIKIEFNVNDPNGKVNETSIKQIYHSYTKYAKKIKTRIIRLPELNNLLKK